MKKLKKLNHIKLQKLILNLHLSYLSRYSSKMQNI